MSGGLRLNPVACAGHGSCAELLPELISLDEWGYPVLAPGPVPDALDRGARRAVAACPALALILEAGRGDSAETRCDSEEIQSPLSAGSAGKQARLRA